MRKNIVLYTCLLVIPIFVCTACTTSTVSAAVSDSTETESAAVEDNTGLCSNDFYPISSDKTLQYTFTLGDNTGTYSVSFKDISDSSFTSLQTYTDIPDASKETNWQCSADGLLSNSYINMNVGPSPRETDYETLEVTGVTLLPDDQWEVGIYWDNTYLVQFTMKAPDKNEMQPPDDNEPQNENEVEMQPPQDMQPPDGTQMPTPDAEQMEEGEMQTQSEIDITREIAAIESLTVPAGTYDEAYRVDVTGVMTVTLPDNQKASMPLMYTEWYVKGVGLVKVSSSDAHMPYSVELSAID